jgi:transcription antitermination protein NusB
LSSGLSARGRLDRTRARGWALQVLYRWDGARDASLYEALDDILRTRRVAESRIPLIREHVERVAAHLDEVDRVLDGAMENWRLDRLSSIDRSVLRLSASELLFDEDVPPRVALQEGIRLAGQYGGDESSRFVNGVLDAILRQSDR